MLRSMTRAAIAGVGSTSTLSVRPSQVGLLIYLSVLSGHWRLGKGDWVSILDNGVGVGAGATVRLAMPDDAEVREQEVLAGAPVRAPHFSELIGHGPVELARIVAAKYAWLQASSGDLIDPDGVEIARTIEDAATAMGILGWFDGDRDGELWIDWHVIPDGGALTATAVRFWIAHHEVHVTHGIAMY